MEKKIPTLNSLPEVPQITRPLNPQQVRQHEIAFDVSRKFAPTDLRLQCLLVEAVDWAFVLDNSERETMEVCETTDKEYIETKLGLRDGTIKLDTSWIDNGDGTFTDGEGVRWTPLKAPSDPSGNENHLAAPSSPKTN